MRKLIISILSSFLLLFVFSVSQISAKVITSENGSVNISKLEVVDDDLFIGAQAVEIGGTVNGDVFVGAQSVKVTGVINGNLHVGANSLDISGTVKGNVYAGGQNISVNGAKIGGSLLMGASTISVNEGSIIGGSIIAGSGIISIDSQVKRSVYVGAGSLTIGEKAVIGKDLYYSTGEVDGENISDEAKIVGNVYKSEMATRPTDLEDAKKDALTAMASARVVATIISLVGALLVGFLYFKFAGDHFTQTAGLVSKSFWKSFGVGFLVTISFIPGVIILLMTVIGIPLAGLSILFLILYMYLAKIVVGLSLGNWISQRLSLKLGNYGIFALGLLAVYSLKLIPVVGSLACLVVFWVGVGSLTLQMFTRSK